MVETVRSATDLPLDVHLMIASPTDTWMHSSTWPATLTLHTEAADHLHGAMQHLKRRGVRAGVTVNPATPLVMLEEVLPIADQVLIMSVNPGFGGKRSSGSPRKIERAFGMIERMNPACNLEVDGGSRQAISAGAAAGADMFVGSGVSIRTHSVNQWRN
ncbi:MAG: hypothetical protein R2848_07915 [Thermomicrobiales bacterium]